jgi:hypothetical protein
MINSFSQFLVEEEKVAYFAFGRMNPPTIGHGKLMDKLASSAGRNPYFLYLSQSNDKKDNPLEYTSKVKYIRKMFPKHARQVLVNKKVKTPFDALTDLYDRGYRKIVMIAGSDRLDEYKVRLNNYNGKKGKHGFYNFPDGIQIVSAGQRDPDAKGAEGASGTKQRSYVSDNNFTSFSQGLPDKMSNTDAKKLFNDIRKGMGLKEETEFRNSIQLEPISDIREKYINGELFNEGDMVEVKESGEKGIVIYKGSNYLIVEKEDGSAMRKWLDSVKMYQAKSKDSMYDDRPDWGTDASNKKARSKTPGQTSEKTTQPQDSDIKDRPGTQPKGYYAGIKTKSTKLARARHFSKHGKKADDDRSAYKPAPGDATAKTKPSKHTLKFKQMYGEDAIKIAQAKIDREKETDKLKHDRMLDRARLARARAKNRATE